MLKSEFHLYFKNADDYLASGYSLTKYYDVGLEQFFLKHNLDIHQLLSRIRFAILFRFINKTLSSRLSFLNNLKKWEQIYDEYRASGLPKNRFHELNNHKIGVSHSTFFELLRAIEFKKAYENYRELYFLT